MHCSKSVYRERQVAKTKQRRGRPPTKREGIVEEVRRWILDGKFKPGDKLPPYVEQQERFGVTNVTLRRAMARLRKEGFIVTKGPPGTFVADYPPHLYNFGIAFYTHPDETLQWSTFYTGLCNAADDFAAGSPYTVEKYYNQEPKQLNTHCREFRRQVEAQRFTGLILTNPTMLNGIPFLRHTGIPRVCFMAPEMALQDVPAVYTDYETFWSKAFWYLADQGRKRVAVMVISSTDSMLHLSRCEQAKDYGLEIRPYWVQSVARPTLSWARNVAQMLCHPDMQDGPDALIIADDHLVSNATLGLRELGVQAPGNMTVVAHCNFGLKPEAHVPTTFIGFDIRRAFAACVEQLELMRAGKQPTPGTLVEAMFEEEVEQALPQ